MGLDFGGLVQLDSVGMIAALPYDRPFPTATIQVATVRLRDGQLCFRPEGPLRPSTGQSERLVFDFANLAEASERAFLGFAAVWGVLGLCPHGYSIHHLTPPCLPRPVGDEYRESIARWRGRARHVRSLLNIRTALNQGEPGDAADWRRVWRGPPPTQRITAANTLAVAASVFLGTAQVQPMVQCVDGRLTVTFIGGNFANLIKAMSVTPKIGPWLASSGNLLAEIAIHTVLAIQEGHGWMICSSPDCRHLYRASRHPAAGRLHFCPSCGKRASWRLSKRRRLNKENSVLR
jgi:hypothetical protein